MKNRVGDWYIDHKNSLESSSVKFNTEWILQNAEMAKESCRSGMTLSKIKSTINIWSARLHGGEKSN